MYRPIALLPNLSRAAEAIIHNRLSSHFTENNVINNRQAAYVKGESRLLFFLPKQGQTPGNFESSQIGVQEVYKRCGRGVGKVYDRCTRGVQEVYKRCTRGVQEL